MYAMELSGAHVSKLATVTYRFKSWPSSRGPEVLSGWIGEVRHMAGGELWLTIMATPDIKYARTKGGTRIPFDAEVVILD